MIGSGGSGGESFRSVTVTTLLATFFDFGSSSESFDEEESDDEPEDEVVDFLAPSESVALLSEFKAPFLLDVESLSDSDEESEESESEAGNGIFWAMELEEESDSLSDESLSEELDVCATFFVSEPSSSELEPVSEEDDSLLDELDLTTFASSEDESDSEDDVELSLEDGEFALVFTFLTFGASSSELESGPEVEDSLLDETALRFRPLGFGFGDGVFVVGDSFSSSASLSELLEEAEDEREGDLFTETFVGGASVISTSLAPLDSWTFALLFSTFACLSFRFLVTLPFSPTVAFESAGVSSTFN